MTNTAEKIDTTSEAAAIRRNVQEWTDAAFSKDIPRVMKLYAEDVRAFDAPTPLQFRGKTAYQAHWEKCMEMCPEDGQAEVVELEIELSGQMAVSTWIMRFTFTDEKQGEQEYFMRMTQVWGKGSGEWLIRHEHCSAPMDMETQQHDCSQKP